MQVKLAGEQDTAQKENKPCVESWYIEFFLIKNSAAKQVSLIFMQ